MDKYILKANNGNYLARKKSGEHFLTNNIANAIIDDEPTKLCNIMNTMPKNLQPYEPFRIYKYNKETGVETLLEYTSVELQKMTSKLESVSVEFQHMLDNESFLYKELQQYDLQLSDMLHYIEFHKFSASEGYKLCKQIQEIRDNRRKVKNELEYIKVLKTSGCKSIAYKKVFELFDGIQKKRYTPRKLKQLFIDGENRCRDSYNMV